MTQNAVTPDKAIAYVPGRGIERRLLERLIEQGVIHLGKAGTYWLDIPGYDVWLKSRRRRAGLAVGAAVAIGVALGFLAGSG